MSKGMTFIELLIALAIVGILSTLATPSFFGMTRKYQGKALANTIFQSLNYARIYAIRSGKTITLCGTLDGVSCSKENFSALMIFIDTNQNHTFDDNEKKLQQRDINYQGQLNARMSLNRNYIDFKRDGTSKQAGSFIYCDPLTEGAAQRVTTSRIGRAYRGYDKNKDGIVEDTSGKAIRCSS